MTRSCSRFAKKLVETDRVHQKICRRKNSMKLAELKEKFKNKYLIRIVAGVLIVTMAGSGAAAGNVYAAKNTKTEICLM
jgi:hypothetical protein